MQVAERPRAVPGVRALGRDEAAYPAGLRDLPDATRCVWLRGADLPPVGRCAAIVGARAASPYGVAMADRLARDLAALGWTVVSGLARGIDAAAHRGALAAGGRTVAVVPSGLDAVTPPAHDPLAAEVAAHGTLVSEIASGPPFGPGAFVRRNRLIAALSAVTVVVEAGERSGALSTAGWARRLGRGLCAVPGDLDRPTARGVLALLRAGARPCGDASDVLALAHAAVPTPPEPRDGAPGTSTPPSTQASPGTPAPPLERLAAALAGEPRTVDDLAARAGLPVADVLAGLLRLAWAGVAVDVGGQRWRRAGSGRT